MPPCDARRDQGAVRRSAVSILVLVDAALRRVCVSYVCVCVRHVSILVLVDAALRRCVCHQIISL